MRCSIFTASEKNTFQNPEVDLLLRQEWFDARLVHEGRPGVFLNGIHHHRELWLPDSTFVKKGSVVENSVLSSANVAIHILANGTVQFSWR